MNQVSVTLGPLLSPCITDSELRVFFLSNLSKSVFLLVISILMGALFTHLNQCHCAAGVVVAQRNPGVARFHS